MVTEVSEKRLERIEQKIDDLSQAFIVLARTEEKMVTIERDRQETNNRINSLESKVNLAEKKIELNGQISSALNKLFWLIVASIAAAVAMNFFG